MIFTRTRYRNQNHKVLPNFGSQKTKVKIQKPFDVYLFFTTLMLVLIGVMMIFSSSAILAQERYGDTYYFLKKEMIYIVVGLVALFTTKKIDYKHYQKLIFPMMIAALVLMAMSFIPQFGHSAGGARRWIRLGGFGLQPSEITKVVVIMLTAYLIDKKQERIREFAKGYVPVIALAGFYIGLILLQKDLGSAFVLGSVVFLMLFVSGTRTAYLIGSILAAAPVLYLLIFSVSFRKRRILAFLDPWKYKLDYGFQIIQSFVAFRSGGLTGVGLGESKQKLFYLPEAHTDFIFSVFGEEFGMLGVVFVAGLFLFFVYRGIKIAQKTKDLFGMFLALGLTSLVGLQAFINFGVVMGVLPTKGLALPFISYGGTSLIMSLACVGILLNVSTHTGEEVS
ncbi:MAG: putative lipid II flippase FtsW [Deltaproteobacteria bacterium]|nr:putative lipid II flippase FtsW [Deltaproteobacteria bacterium]